GFFFENFRNYADMTAEEYIEESFGTNQRTLLKLDRIKRGDSSVSALTYNYPIVTGISYDGQADAVVQFLIREETLESFFMPLLQRTGSHVLLMDGEGNTLSVLIGEGAREQEISGFEVTQMVDITGSIEAKLGEERALLVYRRSEKNNLIMAAVIPEDVVLEDARHLRRVSFVMMFISMFVELALGFYFAWKYSSPIKNLVQNIYRMLNPEGEDIPKNAEGKSEYEHLESGINQLLQTNQSMQITLQEKQQKEKKNFLTYLFSGEFRENEDILREGALVGLELGNMVYCVVSFAMADLERGEEVFKESGIENVLAVYPAKEYMSVLFGFDTLEQAEVLPILAEQIIEKLTESGVREIRGGIGRRYPEEKDIHFSYVQSLYSVLTSKEMVTVYNNISQNLNALTYSTELENKLINSTKHGEIRQIQQIFEHIREENFKKRHLSNSMGRILISNVVATLIKVYKDIILNEELEEVVGRILRLESISEALDCLEAEFIRIGEESAHSRDEREENYQKRLIAYVEQNYSNPQLGVAMASEEFTLSENYFSQLFKDVM
ncbi:MAG: cache domain-containing protein, partial [Lachnospiraceae bacterium]|nr:cache domain-containing protein [Lachnospiraceae bacterium]